MAQIQYSPTPSVEPTDRAPDDFQRIDARPEAFGASIGQGMQQLGAGAEKATQFYGQVAADDLHNQFIKQSNEIRFGVPGAMVQQADGTIGPDTGYNGIKDGAEKMRQYPLILKKIEDARKELQSKAPTAESQFQFDTYSRHYMQNLTADLGNEFEKAHTEYALNTNKQGAELHLSNIARNPDDENYFNGERENLRTQYVRAAQVQGLGPDAIVNATRNADTAAWKMRIETIGATQPDRAIKMAQEHKQDLGTEWKNVDASLRSRASQMQGTEYGQAKADELIAGRSVNDRPMTYDPVRKEVVFKDTGLPPTDAEARASISTPGEIAKHGTTREEAERGPTAAGVGGFGAALGRTFTEEGGYNAHDANGAPVNFGINQKSHPEVDVSKLTREQAAGIYKRDYWDAIGGDELSKTNPSLAHVAFDTAVVEGAGRAKAWLAEAGGDPQKFLALREQYERGLVASDPSTYAKYAQTWQNRRAHLASDIGLPGGAPSSAGGPTGLRMASAGEPPAEDNPASGFPTPVNFTGEAGAAGAAAAPVAGQPAAAATPPAAPEQDYGALKAKGLHDIETSGMEFEAKQRARETFTQALATHEMLAGESERAKRDANEKAYNGYVTELLGGGGRVNPNILARVANDPSLTAATKEHLYDRIVHQSGSDVESKKMEYGPGYWQARQDIVDRKIADPDTLRKMAGPGGTLTLAGEDNLRKTMDEVTKSVMTHSVEATRVSMLKYAKDMLSFDQTMLYPGVKPLEDPKGRELFEGQFMPLFDDGFEKWVKEGNEPQKYLTKENVDKLAAGLRSKADMDQDRIKAMHDTDVQLGLKSAAEGKPLPPPDYKTPEGIQDEHWKAMIEGVPTFANGARINPEAWVRTLDQFGKVPTERMAEIFDQDQADRASKGLPTLAISGQEILAGLRGQIKPVASQPRTGYRPVMTGEKPGQFVSKQ